MLARRGSGASDPRELPGGWVGEVSPGSWRGRTSGGNSLG